MVVARLYKLLVYNARQWNRLICFLHFAVVIELAF